MDKMNRTFGEVLHDVRKDLGKSQEQIAAMVGVKSQTISKYENGKLFPSEATLKKLADALGVSADYLFDRTTVKKLPEYLDEALTTYNGKRVTTAYLYERLSKLSDQDLQHILRYIEIAGKNDP